MIPKQWHRVRELFDEAVRLSESERAAYLEKACPDDALLSREVFDLLACDSRSDEAVLGAVATVASDVGSEPEADIEDSIGPYQLQGEIGHGGMGTVYRAHRSDDTFHRLVAVKVIRGWADEELVRRFRNEREILAELDHPNITRLLDGGTTVGGLPYLVIEYVEGEPIGMYCDRRRLSISDRIELVRVLCGAFHFSRAFAKNTVRGPRQHRTQGAQPRTRATLFLGRRAGRRLEAIPGRRAGHGRTASLAYVAGKRSGNTGWQRCLSAYCWRRRPSWPVTGYAPPRRPRHGPKPPNTSAGWLNV